MAKFVETPLMKQYVEMKKKHPDAVLLFRVGDFYETFADDAVTASEILGITLTRRANGAASHVALAGFPHHALDTYLPRLVRAGKRVAICEQLEDPKLTKKLVKRGITELVTPGVNINDNILDTKENNFLAGVHFGSRNIGVAFLDISTGEFLCSQGTADYVDKLLGNISPKELLIMRGLKAQAAKMFTGRYFTYELDDWIFTADAASQRLLKHFKTASLKGFGVAGMHEGVIAAGALLHYLDLTHHSHIDHITSLGRIDEERYVGLDSFTIRNLELVGSLSPEGKCLVDYLDKTATPMGARMLRRRVKQPLRDVAEINARLDVVTAFFKEPDLRDSVHETLGTTGDLERLIARVSVQRATPRDLVQLKNGLCALSDVRDMLASSADPLLREMAPRLSPPAGVTEDIGRTLTDDAPVNTARGNYIAEGVDSELDQLRHMARSGRQMLDEMLRREIEATGITSLKIAFNNVFGYYIEVRNTHRDKVPAEWIRKQTLVNAERYVTPELKDYEEKITGAQERIAVIESRIFVSLLERVAAAAADIRANAAAAANADCLLSFALAAAEYRYTRPDVNDSLKIDIRAGRHPVIERSLPPGEPYIANSVMLDNDTQQIMMITGPNMSGKSALLRQTALIVLMAQMGCYVPAESASVGIVDKIFTRVGASDNISSGESTFMVEMNEAAAILNNMTNRSLVLFDELGRGTSTYDGISIAWSIVEHIHQGRKVHPKTLFATHYHELNDMARLYPRIANYNVSVQETGGKVVFLRKLVKGGSAHSFGIHVARLAGMPPAIVKRASQVLAQLEASAAKGPACEDGAAEEHATPKADRPDTSMLSQGAPDGIQLSFFQLDDPLLNQLRDQLLSLDIDNLTPMQALNTLNSLKNLLLGK